LIECQPDRIKAVQLFQVAAIEFATSLQLSTPFHSYIGSRTFLSLSNDDPSPVALSALQGKGAGLGPEYYHSLRRNIGSPFIPDYVEIHMEPHMGNGFQRLCYV